MVEAMKQELLLCTQQQHARLDRTACWFRQFTAVLDKVHAATGLLPGAVGSVAVALGTGMLEHAEPIDEAVAGRAFDAFMNACWMGLPAAPRSARSGQVMCCTYENWFADAPFEELDRARPESWCSAFHRTGGMPSQHLHSLLRFRLGAHGLGVATGRWSGVPRVERCCQWCGRVDDEFHLVFECPALSCVREEFVDLFVAYGGSDDLTNVSPVGRAMAGFLRQSPSRVAAFVHQCLELHAAFNSLDFPPTPVVTEDGEGGVGSSGSFYSAEPLEASVSDEFVSCDPDVSGVSGCEDGVRAPDSFCSAESFDASESDEFVSCDPDVPGGSDYGDVTP